MALALHLGEYHTPPQQLTVTLDEVDGRPTVVSSALRVRARVPGAETAAFQKSVDEAAELCPISRLFAGTAITVDATLQES